MTEIGKSIQEFKSDSEIALANQQAIDHIVKNTDTTNLDSISSFGDDAQTGITNLSDRMIEGVKGSQSGEIGDLVNNVLVEMNAAKRENNGGGALSWLPFVNQGQKAVDKMLAKLRKADGNISVVANELQKEKFAMEKNSANLAELFDENADYFKKLTLNVEAGEVILEKLRSELAEMNSKYEDEPDGILLQEIQEKEFLIARFEQRMIDLRMSKEIAAQTAPQILLLSNNSRVVVERINSLLKNTIPMWKRSMAMSISIAQQEQSNALTSSITDMNNQMLLSNAKSVRRVSKSIAREAQRPIVNFEALEQSGREIIATIQETNAIIKENAETRKQLEAKLEGNNNMFLQQISDSIKQIEG